MWSASACICDVSDKGDNPVTTVPTTTAELSQSLFAAERIDCTSALHSNLSFAWFPSSSSSSLDATPLSRRFNR